MIKSVIKVCHLCPVKVRKCARQKSRGHCGTFDMTNSNNKKQEMKPKKRLRAFQTNIGKNILRKNALTTYFLHSFYTTKVSGVLNNNTTKVPHLGTFFVTKNVRLSRYISRQINGKNLMRYRARVNLPHIVSFNENNKYVFFRLFN
jgi:hypothetical protein